MAKIVLNRIPMKPGRSPLAPTTPSCGDLLNLSSEGAFSLWNRMSSSKSELLSGFEGNAYNGAVFEFQQGNLGQNGNSEF